MKKLFVLLTVALMGTAAVSAQSQGNFYFGPKAGITTDATNVKVTSEGLKEVWESNQNYNAGLMFRANLPISIFSLHIQPELMYHWKKGQYSDDNKVVVKDMTINSFDIPLLVGAGIDLGLFNARVQVGPTIEFNSATTLDQKTEKIDWKDISYTWAAGVGIDLFSFIMLDFRYLGGWQEGMAPTKFSQLFEFDRINKDVRVWNFSVGLMF